MPEYMRSRRPEEGDSFFCRFTFGQFFALLVLEVMTLFFVFYLGARYGREFLGLGAAVAVEEQAVQPESPDEQETKVITTADPEAAQMAKELIEKAQTPELKERIGRMIADAQGTGEPKMPRVEERNSAEPAVAEVPQNTPPVTAENAAAPKPAEPPPAAPAAEVPPAPKQGPVEQAKTAQAPEESKAQAAPEDDREMKAASSTSSVIRVKSAENAKYSIQLGSYPKMAEATQSVEKWKVKGYPAFVVIADIPERGRWYRVRMGGFATHDDAAKYLKDVKSREEVDALIVVNEQ